MRIANRTFCDDSRAHAYHSLSSVPCRRLLAAVDRSLGARASARCAAYSGRASRKREAYTSRCTGKRSAHNPGCTGKRNAHNPRCTGKRNARACTFRCARSDLLRRASCRAGCVRILNRRRCTACSRGFQRNAGAFACSRACTRSIR